MAEYNGISWALDLQNTQEAEATMIAEMAAQAAVEGGSRQPGAHREGDEVSDAAAEQLTPATIEAISEVPSQDLAAVVQSDERLFALVAHVWAEVLKRLPDAQSANGAGFALFLTLLFYVFPTPYDVVTAYRDGVERNRDAIEQEVHQRADEAHARALEETQQQLRALAASALTAPRWQARRTVVLRAEPTVAATALARLPAGTEVVERARVGHWVHVELVSSPLGSPSSGWVYQRHLTLVARTAALDHPSAPK